jgi:hypothetical protein
MIQTASRQIVDDMHCGTLRQQRFDKMGTDEARSARYHRFHRALTPENTYSLLLLPQLNSRSMVDR